MVRWFRRDGSEWVVDAALRRMVSFRRFNLLDSFGWLDDLDLVLCRNVLMYFDPATRAGVLARMADTLAPDGVLVLGETETPDAAAFVAGGDGAGHLYEKPRAALARRVLDQRLSAQPFQHPDRRALRLGQLVDVQMEGLLQREFPAQRGMQHLVGEDQPAGAGGKADRLVRAVLLEAVVQLGRHHAATASARHSGCAGRG